MRARFAKQDNQHLGLKVALRVETLRHLGVLPSPMICITHGGLGQLAKHCYPRMTGMMCEKESSRVDGLAVTWPTWRIYQGDSSKVFAGGLGAETVWDVLDVDPYGSPWPTLEGLFQSSRVFATRMGLCVTDGARQKQRLGGTMYGWEPWEDRHGKGLWNVYLRCSQERLTSLVQPLGYRLAWWHGRYGGRSGQMTYWAAVIRRDTDAAALEVQA